ncbi:MAG: hypothetical protein AB1716_02130, partial [Planctomycetota bacterium]
MRIASMAMAGLVSLLVVGCQATPKLLRATERGKHGRRSAVRLAQVIQVQRLVPGENYSVPSGQVLQLEDAVGPYTAWRILVGSNPSGGSATVRCGSGTEPDIYIENGWILAQVSGVSTTTMPSGNRWGRARTQRVSGTTEGTRFIVHEQGGLHHVILLTGPGDTAHATLTDVPAPANRDLDDPHTYIEVDAQSQTLPPPVDYAAVPNSPVAELVEYVER